MTKLLIVVMDSVGVGSLPDAAEFGDEGSNTLGHIAEAVGGLKLPNLEKIGLGKIIPLQGVSANIEALGAYGRMAEKSRGKDTTTGHWEMMGIFTKDPMPTFPHGFPTAFMADYEKRIGRKTLGNTVASGTEIIKELGEEHMRTGRPIVYTSADSVFQIAAHEEVLGLDELYRICHVAREMLTGELAVGRVIARPFVGKPGAFVRTPNRHDYSLEPPGRTILDALKEKGEQVIGVGKISDIFAGRGLTASYTSKSNDEGVSQTITAWRQLKSGLIFTNLVEFDSQYGHRNDPAGYGRKLEELDARVPELVELVRQEGILLFTADHGNDPTTPSTDHSREYIPLLICGAEVKPGVNLGDRATFADIAETVKELFKLDFPVVGQSFLPEISK